MQHASKDAKNWAKDERLKLSLPITRLNVVRRYLLGALFAALIPLALIAGLYDRYSANLLNNLIANRVETNLEATAARMSNFMAVQVKRLENIADLPDATDFFKAGSQNEVSLLLSDILSLEAENPDIYAIELSDNDGTILHTVPRTRSRSQPPSHSTLPLVQHESVEVLGPVLPDKGRPGWFLISKPVMVDHQKIGTVSLRMRLASLTEQTGALVEPSVFEPQIVVFDRVRLTPVGTAAAPKDVIAMSRQFFPGWRIHLVSGRNDYQEPKTYIRYLLMFVAVLTALGVIFLFYKMSMRLSGYLQPLSKGAQAVANGDFSVRVIEDGPGELGILARSYNRMREQLGKLIESRVEVERRAALGSMAAGIAHEIRNPLTTVSTTVHGLKRSEEDPVRKEMFDVISSEIARADDAISEFLNYARPSDPEKEPVSVKEAFRTIKTLISATAHEKHVVISISGESDLVLLIDPTHFRQILLNLMLNAIEAMPGGGHLTIRAYRDSGHAVLLIADDGIGMGETLQTKIMRPFFTTRANGSGLGLPITKQLVDANDGTFAIESEPQVGTTITLTFPFSRQTSGERS